MLIHTQTYTKLKCFSNTQLYTTVHKKEKESMETESIKRKAEQDQKNRQKLAKVMGGNLVQVNVELFEPYVKFAKEYMQFFNVQDSFEIFCMRLIYAELERLHNDLTEFVDSKDGKHFVEGTDWYAKNPHIACTSHQIPDEEE
jgi:hypothetical protein